MGARVAKIHALAPVSGSGLCVTISVAALALKGDWGGLGRAGLGEAKAATQRLGTDCCFRFP